jgi:hypothetical protein
MGIAAILTIIYFGHRYFSFRKPNKKGKGNARPGYSPLKSKHHIRVKIIAVKILNPIPCFNAHSNRKL